MGLSNLPLIDGAGANEFVRAANHCILDESENSSVPVHVAQRSVYCQVLKLAHKEGCYLINMGAEERRPPEL